MPAAAQRVGKVRWTLINSGHEWRLGPDQNRPLLAVDFGNANDFELGPVLGPSAVRTKVTELAGTIKERLAGLLAGRNELCGCQIAGKPLEPERNLFIALNSDNSVIPVRQPLRCNCRECGEDQAHQRRRDQSFKQREAAQAVLSALRRCHLALTPLQADRADFHRSADLQT